MKRLVFIFILLTLFIIFTNVIFARENDPSGIITGNIVDIHNKSQSKFTLIDIANEVGHNRIAINFIWALIAGFLVMFMQAGFAMVETGFTRAKNVAHTMAMNFLIYAIGMIGFWICGFAFMFGGIGPITTRGGYNGLNRELSINLFGKNFGLLGLNGFFLSGTAYDVAIFALFLFQMVFMDTAATIPTGAMAERWRFLPFVIFSLSLCFFILSTETGFGVEDGYLS